jgi:hypothetical protein
MIDTKLIAAAVVAALVASNVLLYNMYRSEVTAHASYVAQVDAAQAQIAALNAAKLRDAEAATADIARDWAAYSSRIGTDYNSRLRQAKRDCAGVSGAAATAALVDAATSERPSGAESFEAICLQTEQDAAKDAGQVMWLQDYVTRVCK